MAAPRITFSRKVTPLKVLSDGVVVGEIYRVATGHYALALNGWYWNSVGQHTRKGGRAAIGFKTLREARERAVSALS